MCGALSFAQMFNTSAVGLPTWRKLVILSCAVDDMRIRDKRKVFQLMRSAKMDEDVFLPHMGVTLSVFATFQVLADSHRRVQRS